MWKWYRS